MLLDTSSNETFVNQDFVDLHQLATAPSIVLCIVLSNKQVINIKVEARHFYMKLGDIQNSLAGPVLPNITYNIIAGMDWLH